MGRAPCCDKASVKRGPWSPEEDQALRSHIQRHGTGGNWIALPRKAGLNRCGKSCRLRWLNYLRPDIKHGGFTEEEDAIICNLYYKLGSRWSVIASHLHGRTDNDVKNYWNTKLKKKLMARGTSPSISIPTYGSSPSSPLIPPVAPSPFCSAKEQLVSPSEEISVASSAVTADDGSGVVSYRNDWGGGDDLLLTESDFRLLSDILDGHVGFEDKSSWDSSETLFLPPW